MRWSNVGDLGKIRRRPDTGTFYLDLRPYGRVWSNRGIPITDEKTADRLLEQIRGKVAEGCSLEEVIASYLPAGAKPNLVPTRVPFWNTGVAFRDGRNPPRRQNVSSAAPSRGGRRRPGAPHAGSDDFEDPRRRSLLGGLG